MDFNNLERKQKVVHGGDFRDRWEGVYITEDQFNYCYETSDSEDVTEQLLFNEFENHGFSFDPDIHEDI